MGLLKLALIAAGSCKVAEWTWNFINKPSPAFPAPREVPRDVWGNPKAVPWRFDRWEGE
jgi:hypothetical protein